MPSHRIVRSIAAAGIIAAVATLAACAPASDSPSDTSSESAEPTYVTEGKLTIATGEPAYYPYVIDDAPESGEGFESAVAYAVAEQLGFAEDDVVWVRTGFEEAIQPGPKSFDLTSSSSPSRPSARRPSTSRRRTTRPRRPSSRSPGPRPRVSRRSRD